MAAVAFTSKMTLERMTHSAHAIGSTALAAERVERKLAVILAADVRRSASVREASTAPLIGKARCPPD
jgi:hypothetical protein